MKRHILLRIILVPIKLLSLVFALLFIALPCLFLDEVEFSDTVLSWIEGFGNYKRR